MTATCRIVVDSPAELIAVTPYMLGFHPTDSLVVIGTEGRSVTFGARWDLPPPEENIAAGIASIVVRQRVETATVIGYGPPTRVTPAVLRLGQALVKRGVHLQDLLRVADGRWWSYTCQNTRCCPPEGQPLQPELPIAAEAVFRGQVALPNRQALIAQVAAVTGAPRAAITAATERAKARLTDLRGVDVRDRRGGRSVRRAGRAAVREAERCYRSGNALTDDQVAWLGVLLVDVAVEDYALDRSDDQEWRIRLWTDVVRRVEPAYAAAPASLLGFAAWRDGNGSLARVAVDRALTESPGHGLAELLDRVLAAALAPYQVELGRSVS